MEVVTVPNVFGKMARANSIVVGLPANRVLFTEPESSSLIGDNCNVASGCMSSPKMVGYTDGSVANFRAAKAIPAAIFDGSFALAMVVAVVGTGVRLKRFSFSVISFATSGVGICGRAFDGNAKFPFRFDFESANKKPS